MKNNMGWRIFELFSKFAMFALAIIQLFDFIFTSIAIQDFLGTGKTFIWGVKESYAHTMKLPSPSNTYYQDHELHSYENTFTKWGSLILKQLSNGSDDYMWASVGYFDTSKNPEAMDKCVHFQGNYTHLHPKRNRLMVSDEKLTLLSPGFDKDEEVKKSLVPNEGDVEQLEELLHLGYVGTRRSIAVKITARIDLPEWLEAFEADPQYSYDDLSSGKDLKVPISKEIKAVYIFGKSFCDGCKPIAELGQMFCSLKGTLTKGDNFTDYKAEITEAHYRKHTKHRMGVAFQRSNSSVIESFLRIVLLFYIIHSIMNILTNSCKSNEERWWMYKKQDATAAILFSSLVKRPFFAEFLHPQQNIARTSPFSLSFFMYNSDIIVFLNLVVVFLTFFQSMQLKYEIVHWATYDETFRAVITRIGVNSKIMWLYLACIKLFKHVLAKLGFHNYTQYMCYHSYLFVWFWIIYLLILSLTKWDFLLQPMFNDRVDISNDFMLINDISVSFFDGYYFIRIPGVILHTIVVSLLATGFLISVQHALKLGMLNNSLYLTLANCHSTIMWDPELFIKDDTGQAALVPLGTLMNLKWLLKTQCITYPSEEMYNKIKLMTSSIRSSSRSSRRDGPSETEDTEDTICSMELGLDGALHIRTRPDDKDIEHLSTYHTWLHKNRTIIVV